MYVPKHQYEVKTLLEPEGRIRYTDGTPFAGSKYVEFSNGVKYDVPEQDLQKGIFDRARKIETQVDTQDPKLLLDFLKTFIPKRPSGKPKTTRYFMKRKVDSKIVEIDKDSFDALNNGLPSHIVTGQMEWYTAGPLYDISSLNMTQEGTTTKNARELENLEKTLPGIKSYVRDLTFLSDPQYADQKPQIAQSPITSLPSPS
jgi:hypothetical protein